MVALLLPVVVPLLAVVLLLPVAPLPVAPLPLPPPSVGITKAAGAGKTDTEVAAVAVPLAAIMPTANTAVIRVFFLVFILGSVRHVVGITYRARRNPVAEASSGAFCSAAASVRACLRCDPDDEAEHGQRGAQPPGTQPA